MKVEISFDPVNARLKGKLTTEMEERLSAFLSYMPQGANFRRAYKNQRVYFFRLSDYSFPAGFVQDVKELLEKEGHTVMLKPLAKRPGGGKKSTWIGPELRDYQKQGIEEAAKAGRGIFHVAVGGGKMLMTAGIIHTLGLRTTVIVWTNEAVNDTADEIHNAIYGLEVGRYSGAVKSPSVKYITVTSMGALRAASKSKNELWKHFYTSDVIIMDEAHHIGGFETKRIWESCPAYYRFGQTGTPFRTDNRDLLITGLIGSPVVSRAIKDLQSAGVLASFDYVFLNSPQPDNLQLASKMQAHDFYVASIVENRGRNEMIASLFKRHKKDTVLCIVKEIRHGEILSELTGVEFVSGGDKKRREAVRAGLNSGKIKHIIASQIYDESANFPAINVGIDAGGHSSGIRTIQRLGRAIRQNPEGNKHSIIYSFDDLWHATTAKHSRTRKRMLRTKEGIKPVALEESQLSNFLKKRGY